MNLGTYVGHARHGVWTQHDRDVICACGARLYAGRSPRSEEQRIAAAQILDRIEEIVREGGVHEPSREA